MLIKKNKPGFTLIEIILYTFLTSFILTALTFFLGTILSARVKNQTVSEVEQQGIQIMQQMTQSIRNAKIINSPAQATTASTLSINGVTSANNPTVFNLVSSAVTMTEGANPAIQLTSQGVVASNLTFQNLSRNATPGLIRIGFTLSRTNPSGKNEYDFTKTFYTSVSLR